MNPVLVAPICRAYFANGDIKRNGRHDLGDKFSKIENGVLYENQSLPADDHSMDYVEAMKIVAQEKNVPFIDLMQATRELYLSYGETQCLKLLFCEGDKTHTNTMGANLIARQAAQLLKEAGILAEYISIPESVSASPNALDFGEVYSGVQQNKELLITGFGLQPATGSVSIAASGDVTISVDKTTYSQSATVNYEGSTLFQKIYVRATYTNEGEQNDNITVSFGNNTLAVPVTASVISLAGGSEVSALWPIVDKATVTNSTVTGPIAANCTMSHMMAADTKSDFTQGDETGITLVRFHNADDGGAKVAWPANEIDENATRYIDFAITAPGTMEVRITKISLDITSHSTSTMCYHINTGFGDNFTDVQTIAEKVNMTNLEIAHLELTPTLTIPEGETLHVRVLPWHNLGEAKSGKYICLRDVKIEGLAFEPGKEGIETIQQPEISSEKMLINGQLMIKRNGVFYHVNGQIVR